jgi:kynurenine formamidase
VHKVIDLSVAVRPNHFRWGGERRLDRTHAEHEVQVTWIGGSVHAFTHMDAPRHFDAAGVTTDAVGLDTVVGPAAVVDVRSVGANRPVTEEVVRRAGAHVRAGDIVLMRAGWDLVESIDTPEFWVNAPWVERDAAEWLFARGIRAIGYDFPQDHCIRNFATGAPRGSHADHVTHDVLLRRGVIMFEYLGNLCAIPGDRTFFVGLPMKVPDSDGAPARAIALEFT